MLIILFLNFYRYLQYTFEAYELEFGKTYDSIEIRASRKAAFLANLAKIEAHNR